MGLWNRALLYTGHQHCHSCFNYTQTVCNDKKKQYDTFVPALAAGQPQKSPSDLACCLANTVLVLQELLQYWKTTYDWRKQEQILNKTMHHYTIPLNAIDLHFVHEKSKHKNAIPLLITHGWPGSILEFTEIIPQLVNPGDKSMQTSTVPVLDLLLGQKGRGRANLGLPRSLPAPLLPLPSLCPSRYADLVPALLAAHLFTVYVPHACTVLPLLLSFADTCQAGWDDETNKASVSHAVALLSANSLM